MKDKKVILALLVASFSVLTYFHAVVKDLEESHFGDFGHYWMNAFYLIQGQDVWGQDKYPQERDIKVSRKHDPLWDNASIPLHSLGFFLLIAPFTLFSSRLAIFFWLILGHTLLFFSIWLIVKTGKTKPDLLDWFIVLFLVFSFWPLRENLYLGQPNLFILFFLTLGIIFIQKRQMLWAGIFFSLAIQMREYLAIMVLFFLWQKKWRVLAGLCLGYFFLKIIGVSIFGWEKEVSYWQYTTRMFLNKAHYSMMNCSTSALIYRLVKDSLGIPICAAIYLVSSAFFTGLAFFWTRKKDTDLLLGFCLFLTLSFLVSPWVHEQHYLALYPVIILLWFRLEEENNFFLYTLFIAAYLFLGLSYSLGRFPQFHSGLLAIFTSGKLLGIIILFFLVALLMQEKNLRQEILTNS